MINNEAGSFKEINMKLESLREAVTLSFVNTEVIDLNLILEKIKEIDKHGMTGLHQLIKKLQLELYEYLDNATLRPYDNSLKRIEDNILALIDEMKTLNNARTN